MKPSQISLSGLLVWSAAIPMWIFVVMMFAYSAHPLGGLAGLLALGGATAAVHWLIRDWQNAWAIAAIVAPLVIFLPILAIAALTAS